MRRKHGGRRRRPSQDARPREPRPGDTVGWIYRAPGGFSWLRAHHLRNPYAERYAADAEPTPREVFLDASGRWPPSRLPERRFAELETELGLITPCQPFRARLSEILETVVRSDTRVSPGQREAHLRCEARRKQHTRRFVVIGKTARVLHRLLTSDDPREQRDIRLGLEFAFSYP